MNLKETGNIMRNILERERERERERDRQIIKEPGPLSRSQGHYPLDHPDGKVTATERSNVDGMVPDESGFVLLESHLFHARQIL